MQSSKRFRRLVLALSRGVRRRIFGLARASLARSKVNRDAAFRIPRASYPIANLEIDRKILQLLSSGTISADEARRRFEVLDLRAERAKRREEFRRAIVLAELAGFALFLVWLVLYLFS